MPDDETGPNPWMGSNRSMYQAARLNEGPVKKNTSTQSSELQAILSTWADVLPGRAAQLIEKPAGGLRAAHHEYSILLRAIREERRVASDRLRRPQLVEAPQWLGLPGAAFDAAGADGDVDEGVEEKELPQMFGISIHPSGGVSGISRSGIEAKESRFALMNRRSSLLTFPSASVSSRPVTPHRSKDAVLPFRAPATKQAVLFFSLVGGVGGTSLAAGLARVLANCGERVMLADAGGNSLLPHYFGGNGSRQGVIRKFIAPSTSKSEAVSMLSLDVESFAWNDEEMDRMAVEFQREASAFDRVVWDLGNAPVEWSARILRQGARIIVPLLPTAKCLMQLAATESALHRCRKLTDVTRWHYVLNQFDELDPSHIEMRGRFRAQLGERLLPFALRSSPLVNEALMCGRTIVDHAPASPLVSDMWRLTRVIAGLPQAHPVIVPGAWGER